MTLVVEEAEAQEAKKEKVQLQAKTAASQLRRNIDNAFQNPSSSLFGIIYGWVDIACIILSSILMLSETEPQIASILQDKTSTISRLWYSLELATIIFFTFDVVVRFLIAYKKLEFIKCPATWLDLFTVGPYFLEISVGIANFHSFKILRIARIARVLKLIKRNRRMSLMVTVLAKSLNELSMLLIVWSMCIVVAGSCFYYIEENTNGDVKSGKSYKHPNS